MDEDKTKRKAPYPMKETRPMASEIKTYVEKLADQDPAVATEAYRNIEDKLMRAGAPGKQQEARDCADALVAELTARTAEKKNKKGRTIPPKPVHSPAVRNKLCRLLAYVADGKQVPALVQQLDDLDVREVARWALDRNTSHEATAALIDALDKVGPRFRMGIVGALGARQGEKVATALRKVAMQDPIPQVRIAAVEMLPRFPGGDTSVAVMRATLEADPEHRERAYRAGVRLADHLAKKGEKEKAQGLYRMIASGPGPAPQKKVARSAMQALK
jgi:HEAT repeat protein